MPLQAGTRLGPYEIITPIGAGGMGQVWLASELRLGRKVALKLLPADLTRNPVRIQRFEQEARAASALNHPNVCTIHALDQTSDGQHYIAMEYVEGETLRQRLATSRLSVREALDIAIQVAAALSAAHTAGIVHRDIKPENVMLRPDGFVKVLDFGLAKLAPTAPELTGADTTRTVLKTDAGSVVGTAAYMSPEQARGQEVDARTDIWSLGVVLFEMVAGRSPFAATSGVDVLAAILDREPAPLATFQPDTPSELQRIVGKALKKDRAQRYQSVHDFLLDLKAVLDDLQAVRASSGLRTHGQVEPQGSESTQTAARAHSRRRGVLAVVAAVLALAVAGGLWWRATSRLVETPSSAPGAAVQRALTRLTSGAGLQTEVTFSPDGQFIAYASDRAGNFDIWVQPVAGGDPLQVTRSPAPDTQPAWSPDGRTVAFRSERDGGGLFLVPARGGQERQLTIFGTHPSWSADGSEIHFLVGHDWPRRFYAMPPDATSPEQLVTSFLNNGEWQWIGAHPDGRVSAMGRHRQLGDGFFTLTRDAKRPLKSQIPRHLPLAVDFSALGARHRFQWHPSGATLFVQASVGGVINLWKVHVAKDTLEWVSAERLTTGPGADVQFAVSRDGTRMAFTSESETSRLWAFPIDSTARRLGRGRALTEEGATAGSSALSPDGRSVAYTLRRPGVDRSELWVTDLSDGSRRRMAENAAPCCWFA